VRRCIGACPGHLSRLPNEGRCSHGCATASLGETLRYCVLLISDYQTVSALLWGAYSCLAPRSLAAIRWPLGTFIHTIAMGGPPRGDVAHCHWGPSGGFSAIKVIQLSIRITARRHQAPTEPHQLATTNPTRPDRGRVPGPGHDNRTAKTKTRKIRYKDCLGSNRASNPEPHGSRHETRPYTIRF
jgi:hypothetical protein